MTPATSLTRPETQGAHAEAPPSFDAKLITVSESDVNPHQGLIAVIPAYNEQIAIGSVLLLVRQYVNHVIVVDDGSTDRTAEVAQNAGAEVIRLDQNMGKAYALLLGLRRARELNCTAAIMLDADGQHLTRDIPRLAALEQSRRELLLHIAIAPSDLLHPPAASWEQGRLQGGGGGPGDLTGDQSPGACPGQLSFDPIFAQQFGLL